MLKVASLAAADATAEAAVRRALANTFDFLHRVMQTLAAAVNPGMFNSGRAQWIEQLTLHVRPVLTSLYEDTFDEVAGGASEQLADVRNRLSETYWADRLAQLSMSIDDVFDAVRDELSYGIEAGEDADALAARIADILDIDATDEDGHPVWDFAARRIARTETILAYNKATFDAGTVSAQLHGTELTKEWLATTDERTRHSHAAADGQVRPLAEPFTVGGAPLQFPGDPDGPPEETINCRCTVLIDEAEPLAAAAPRQYTGGMIALRPADAEELVDSGGEPADELHVTLAFLGDDVSGHTPEMVEHLRGVARGVAASFTPFDGHIAGWGRLGTDGAAVLLLNGGEIGDARDVLMSSACPDCLPEQHAPFIPHMTLGYGTDPAAGAAHVGKTVRFDRVSLDLGGVHEYFPLGGNDGDDLTAAASGIPEQLAEYWTEGKGAAKIRWAMHGSFDRCRRNLAKYVPPGHTLDGLCANLHFRATGKYPGARAASGENDMSVETLLAAVGGSTGLPVAGRDVEWNGDDATGRVIAHCTSGDTVDVACVARAHLWRRSEMPPEQKGAWSLPFADVIGGKMQIVPQGIASVAGGHGLRRLQGASSADLASMKKRVCSIYSTVRNKFADWPECPFTRRDDSATTAAMTDYPVTPPLMPPAEWFADPELDGPTPITITDDGRVFGHLGPDGLCHTGFGNRCETIPHSPSDYAYFRTGELVTADGGRVSVGQITAGGGHADLSLGWVAAKAQYDDVGTAVADVAAGEDRHGVWLAGALRPNITPEQIRIVMGSRPSGDWRPIRGHRELIGAHAVNVPGFPVARAILASAQSTDTDPVIIVGEPVRYLVAAGCDECGETQEQQPASPLSVVERRLVAARISGAARRIESVA